MDALNLLTRATAALAVCAALAAAPAAAAPIDDVRAAVGAPLGQADPGAVAGAVRDAVAALPPEDLEEAIDLVGIVAEEVEGRTAIAEIAGAAQGGVDIVADRHPDRVEEWWVTIVKDSILTVVEQKLAAAEGGTGASGAPTDADLPLVTDREFAGGTMARAEPEPAARPEPVPKPVAAPEPRRQPEPQPPPTEAEPRATAATEPRSQIEVEPLPPPEAAPRRPERAPATAARQPGAPIQLAPPPRTLDQQLADRRAGRQSATPASAGGGNALAAAELLKQQGRPITTENLNQAMIELSGNCGPLDLEALRAAARYGRCRGELAQRLAGISPAAGEAAATPPPLDRRAAFRDMVRAYAEGRPASQAPQPADGAR